jgi:hypothetical protein
LVLFVLLCSSLVPCARAASIWNRTYGGTKTDHALSLIATSDEGYAITGWTASFGAGLTDFWLVKTDALGNIQWNKTYGGTGEEYAYSLVETSDGGYAIAGLTDSFGAGWRDFWLVKTDAFGNMQWNKTYGGTGWDWAFSLVEAPDGGYTLAGFTSSFGDAPWLVKTDALGNMEWNRTYSTSAAQQANSLVATSDGGYAIACDSLLIKTDALGNMQWNKTYGGASLVKALDGGYAIANNTNDNFWLTKTDAFGNMQWNKTYGGTNDYEGRSVVTTSDGGYAIAGWTESFGAGWSDFWLVKTDSNGAMQWNRTYGGTGYDGAHSLVATSDGGYILAGYTDSFGAGQQDFWLVKTDENGVVPEFSSWLVPTLVLTATAFIIVNKKRRLRT